MSNEENEWKIAYLETWRVLFVTNFLYMSLGFAIYVFTVIFHEPLWIMFLIFGFVLVLSGCMGYIISHINELKKIKKEMNGNDG